jgi:hypothetical protein
MSEQVSRQPRTAIVEAVKTVLERVHTREHACAQCTLGMLLDELGFLEYEFVAAGLSLPCIVATKTTINWDALMMAIEVKRFPKKLKNLLTDSRVKLGNQRPYWLNESLRTEDLKRKNVE